MPRKPKVAKQVIQVLINGKPVAVTLHPPSGAKKSWYVYWPGLVATKSTGQTMLEDAIIAAEAMFKSGAKKPTLTEVLLSDEEFEAIQRAHFDRKKDTAARLRAMKTLKDCRDAISAFRDISKIQPISAATPDDCAAFQRTALTYPKNWRSKHPKSKEDVSTISANTVLKWSRSLQAAFDRASRNSGRKTVRGVVPEQRLLSVNPWKQFTWIEGHQRPIRQFDGTELVSFLDYLEQKFPSVTVATALARTLLWSWGRRTEIVGLRWDSLRVADAEFHFETVGKWGIDKWFRVPE